MLKQNMRWFILPFSLILILSSCAKNPSIDIISPVVVPDDKPKVFESNDVTHMPPTSEDQQAIAEPIPIDERLYLKEKNLLSESDPFTILSFTGQPLSQENVDQLTMKLETTDWLTFQTILANYDLAINAELPFSDNEVNELDFSNEIRLCTVETANPNCIVIQMRGIFGSRGYDYFNIYLFFDKVDDLFNPNYAALSIGQVEWNKFVTVNDDTFLVAHVYGDTGTEYLRNNEYWHNIKTQKTELNYIRNWVDGGLILPNTRCILSYDVNDYHISEFINGTFAIEMPISMEIFFDYYSDEETEEFLKGESLDYNTFEKKIILVVYYDRAKKEFYIDRNAESTYFLGEGLSPDYLPHLFQEELTQLSKSEKAYHTELIDYLFG